MASGKQFIRTDQLPPYSPDPWTTVPGCDIGGLSQAPSKTQVNHWSQRSVAGDLGQPVKSFALWLQRCAKAGSEQFEHTNW